MASGKFVPEKPHLTNFLMIINYLNQIILVTPVPLSQIMTFDDIGIYYVDVGVCHSVCGNKKQMQLKRRRSATQP
jgi:hypothetical protein